MTKTPKTQKDTAARESEAERNLDKALEESFPASDPPAATRVSAGAPDREAAKLPRSKPSPKR